MASEPQTTGFPTLDEVLRLCWRLEPEQRPSCAMYFQSGGEPKGCGRGHGPQDAAAGRLKTSIATCINCLMMLACMHDEPLSLRASKQLLVMTGA
jgi:hypothetical protein